MNVCLSQTVSMIYIWRKKIYICRCTKLMQGQVTKSRQSTKNRVNVFFKEKTDNLSISLKFLQSPIFLIVNIHWDFLSFFFCCGRKKKPDIHENSGISHHMCFYYIKNKLKNIFLCYFTFQFKFVIYYYRL